MTTRKLGYRRAPDGGPRHLDAAKHLGAGPVPETSDLTHLTTVLNQDSEDCTANGIAEGVRGCQIALGAPASTPILSRRALYWLERAYLHETDKDAGAFIHLGFQALNTFGFGPEKFWPYDSDLRRMPPLHAMESAFDQRQPTDYRRILSSGGALVDDVKRALGAGHLVVYGVEVSTAFCNGDLGSTEIAQPPGPGDEIAGGHAMVLCGHRPEAARSLTSWGTGVFDGGYFDMAWDYVETATDLWIVVSAPLYSEASL